MDDGWREYAMFGVLATLIAILLSRRARTGRLTFAIVAWMVAILLGVLIRVFMTP